MKILCVFGKYQYGDQDRGLSTEFFSFVPAIESLGYEMVFFDSWDRTLYKNFIELNIALKETVEKENPDIIFSVQLGYEIWIETWDYIRANFNCKTVNWCTDDSWKYKEHSKFLANHFDLMVTTYEEFISKYHSQNANALLSTWAVPIQWIYQPKLTKECKLQVSFIGAAHGNRKENIKYLQSQGINVECFGYGWDNGPISESEIPRIFNESFISLNFSNSNGENQIKARVFEVTGSGGFLITEDAKNLDKIFDNNEVVVYNNMDECIQKIKYFIKHPDLRDKMVEKSFSKTSTNYTYKNKIQEIIQFLDTIKKVYPHSRDFEFIIKQHSDNKLLIFLRKLLIYIGQLFFGKEKGKRFARRLVYEISWRLLKKDTYKAKSLVGRMFYNE